MTIFDYMRGDLDLDARTRAADAVGQAQAARDRISQLEEHLDKLTLVCAAMWELLKAKTDMTEEELMESIAAVDLQDGVLDGRITDKARPCRACGRPVAGKHRKCLYCGALQPTTGAFDAM